LKKEDKTRSKAAKKNQGTATLVSSSGITNTHKKQGNNLSEKDKNVDEDWELCIGSVVRGISIAG